MRRRYPHFSARILSVNGDVWTGSGERREAAIFPPAASLSGEASARRKICAVSRSGLQYGAFRYYSGGDLTNDTDYGRFPWHDIETPVAKVAGPVSVAVANHHGYFDACGPAMVRALRPRVWVLPTWHVTHPAMSVMAKSCQYRTLPRRALHLCQPTWRPRRIAEYRAISGEPCQQPMDMW